MGNGQQSRLVDAWRRVLPAEEVLEMSRVICDAVDVRRGLEPGVVHPRSRRLSVEVREGIMGMARAGRSRREICERFGVARATVRYWVRVAERGREPKRTGGPSFAEAAMEGKHEGMEAMNTAILRGPGNEPLTTNHEPLPGAAAAAARDCAVEGISALREVLERGEREEWTMGRIRRECGVIWGEFPGARREVGRGFVEGWLAKGEAVWLAGLGAG